MTVQVNGRPRSLRDGATVLDLIADLGLRRPNVVVERNGRPVARASFAETRLEPGDVVEVVRAVAGG